MTRPTRPALIWLAALLPLAALPAVVSPAFWAYWLAATALWIVLIGVDALFLLSARALRIEVATPELLYVGAADDATVRIAAPARAAAAGEPRPGVRFEALLDVGERLEGVPPFDLRLDAAGTATARIGLRPTRRGEAEVRGLWLRWRGPFAFAERVRRVALDRRIPVIPNIRAVRQEALRFFARRQAIVGQKIERYLGEGSEFESLREYQPGFDPRGLDWRATARHRKLLVREYQAERNHPVVIAIDSGHLMREPLAGIPKLDWAINAALLLAYVALKSGDRVGLLSFDSRVREVVLPRRGVAAFPRLQAACARIEYSAEETNYALSVAQITQRVRRRSLVVFFTDFVDSVTAELMLDNLRRLGNRHLLLFVGLRDPGLEELRDERPRDFPTVVRAVVADQLLRERESVFLELGRRGIQCLDRTPDQISAGLVRRYLWIRRREMIG
jgi:uncharacterized protein (DUF58 family)